MKDVDDALYLLHVYSIRRDAPPHSCSGKGRVTRIIILVLTGILVEEHHNSQYIYRYKSIPLKKTSAS